MVMEINQIKDIIPLVINQVSNKISKTQGEIQEIWKGIGDGQVARHSIVVELREQLLIVNVDSSAWLFHLNLKKKNIIKELLHAKINIKEIVFRIGPIK